MSAAELAMFLEVPSRFVWRLLGRRIFGITPSMSLRANPLDNAPMESFFHTLKTELVHHRTYATRSEAKRDLLAYGEGFYNRQRLHPALDCHTPDQAERRAARIA